MHLPKIKPLRNNQIQLPHLDFLEHQNLLKNRVQDYLAKQLSLQKVQRQTLVQVFSVINQSLKKKLAKQLPQCNLANLKSLKKVQLQPQAFLVQQQNLQRNQDQVCSAQQIKLNLNQL